VLRAMVTSLAGIRMKGVHSSHGSEWHGFPRCQFRHAVVRVATALPLPPQGNSCGTAADMNWCAVPSIPSPTPSNPKENWTREDLLRRSPVPFSILTCYTLTSIYWARTSNSRKRSSLPYRTRGARNTSPPPLLF
jgi:hypothetical protein